MFLIQPLLATACAQPLELITLPRNHYIRLNPAMSQAKFMCHFHAVLVNITENISAVCSPADSHFTIPLWFGHIWFRLQEDGQKRQKKKSVTVNICRRMNMRLQKSLVEGIRVSYFSTKRLTEQGGWLLVKPRGWVNPRLISGAEG